MIPMARDPAEIIAIAASLLIFPFPVIRRSRTAAAATTGIDTARGAQLKATAIESAPKETWDSPSPIIEYRFSTRLTPRSDAQSEIQIPPIIARTRNG